LIGGQAIVHAQKLVQIVSVHFKMELSKALATTAKVSKTKKKQHHFFDVFWFRRIMCLGRTSELLLCLASGPQAICLEPPRPWEREP
jgi:hypothetical protein